MKRNYITLLLQNDYNDVKGTVPMMKRKFQGLCLFCIIILSLSGCQPKSVIFDKKETADPIAKGVSVETPATPVSYDDPAMNYLMALDQLGARIAGTPTEKMAADYIVKELESMGYAVKREAFKYQDTFESENIIAEKKGKGGQTIIIGAHYDSVGASKGTDDNGSGVAVALRVAKTLADQETEHTLKFVFFGAEEVGLEGSSYYAGQMSKKDIEDTLLMVNLDSLIAGDIAYVYGNANEQGKYRDYVLELAKTNQLTLTNQPGKNSDYPAGTTGPYSDHAPFEALGMSFIYFESTNWDMGAKDGYTQSSPDKGAEGDFWHTKYDNFKDIEKAFPGRPAERLNTVATLLEKLLIMNLSEI